MDYINEHPKKSSLVIKKNDKYIYSKNAYMKYPVASLFKLIIAIELIHQYQEGKIDLSEKVSVKKLDEYNLTPKMNKSYEQWKNENLKNKKNISLYTIAKGMIDYSANPNADYLIDKLKIKKVNNRAKIITSGNHDQIFKIESTLLVPLYIKEIENKNPEKELKSINDEKFNYKIQKTERR